MLFMIVYLENSGKNLKKRELPFQKLVEKVRFYELYTVTQTQVTINVSDYIPGIFQSKYSYNLV